MKHKEEYITEEKVINTPAGGVLIGKDKDGQTIIPNDGSLGGFLVGRLHKDGGIKAINKGTGQPLEMQSNEIVITAPAVSDQTKREFEGKMMTNREILSKINSDGGGVSFADGGDIPAKIHTTDCEYKFGGKVVKDTDIAHSLGMNSTLKKGKQQFSSGDTTYDVDAIYNAIKKGKLRLKTKEVDTFPMKYPVYDKKYSETVKTDFRKPNGITVRTESGEEVLIDGNHRMNNAYLKGRKTMKTYYIEDPKQISKFSKKNKFELGGKNNDLDKLIQEKFSEGYGVVKHFELTQSGGKWNYIKNPNISRIQRDKMPVYTIETNQEIRNEAKNKEVNYQSNQPKEISILEFAQKFTKDNNGKIYHKSKSGSVYVRVKDKEIRISDHYILDRDSINPKVRYDLEIIQKYFDEKTPSNLDYWTDEFKNGGHLSSGKSLKQIAEMHNVSLAHINEQLAKGLEVEKEHFADFKERTRVAKDHLVENPNYYTILEKAGLKDGGHLIHHRHSNNLVKDAKSGNTPARDLNNYNDIMDLEADGMVGMESGLAYADGGNVTAKRDKTYDLKLDYKIGQTFEEDKLGGKYTCRILAMDFTVNKNGEVNHNSYRIHYYDGQSNSEKSSHFKFLKYLKKEPSQVTINVPYSIGSDIYYESSQYDDGSLSLLKSTVIGFEVLYYGQRVGWFDYYLDSEKSVDSKDVYSSVENYVNKVLSEITNNKPSSLKKLNQFVEPTSEKIKVTVDYFIGQKFKLPVMGGFEDAEIIGIELGFNKDKTYPNSERSIIHYKEADGRIREQELQYFIEKISQQKPNEIEVTVKAKVKDDVLILHRYMGGSKLQITQVQGYILKMDNAGVNLKYCVSDDCYDADAVYTSLENFKESITRKNKKKIEEVDDLSELLEMVKSGNYAKGGEVKDIEPYFESFSINGLSGVDYAIKSQVNFDNLINKLDNAKRGIENKYVGYDKFPFHDFVKKYDYFTKKDFRYSNQDHKSEIDSLVEKLKKDGYTVLTKTYSFTKGASDGFNKNNRAINVFAFKLNSFANGGLTPYDANSVGDSVPVLEDEFAKGGVVYNPKNPKIEKVTIKETKFNRASVIGRNASTVSELQQIVSDYIGTSPKEDVDWIKFYVNDNTRGSYYIDLNKGKKNTVKNVNPETLNSVNFKRVIDANTYLVKNYDWTDFFEGQKQTKKDNSVIKISVTYDSKLKPSGGLALKNNTLELYEFLRGLHVGEYVNVQIQPIGDSLGVNSIPLDLNTSIWENILTKMPEESALKEINRFLYSFYSNLDFDAFARKTSNGGSSTAQTPTSTSASNTGQGTTSTKTPLTKEELKRVKIWIGDDINLKEKVIQKLEEIGFPFDRNNGTPDADKNIIIRTYTIDFVVFKENKEEFNRGRTHKEIFPEDLGIDVTTIGVAPTASSTQSQYPEYYEYVEKSSSSFSKGKIYKIKNPKNLTEAGNFVDDTGVYNGHGYLNAQYFKPSTEEAFLAQQTPVSNTTTDNEVTYISLNYEVNGTPTYYSALTTGKDFIEAINSIEQSNPIQDVSVNIIVGYNDSKNFTQELRENFNFGKGAFRPSNWSVSEIKSIVANDWFDGKLDFDKFFSDIVSTVLASKTPTSTSAYKTDKEVQSVLIKYGNGSEYTALNEESLLSMLKDIWDSNGKTLRTVNIQPQGRVSSLSVFKIVDLIENPVNIEYEINPDKITLDELRDKLSKDKNWYDDLDWSDFFKNQSQTSDKEVNRIKLVYDTGTLRTFICNNGSELFDTFKLIEEQAQGGSLEVKVTLSGNYNNGKFFETQGITQEIGKGGFEPSQIYSFEEFEKIIKGMFTAFNFNNFFKEAKTPTLTSNQVESISLYFSNPQYNTEYKDLKSKDFLDAFKELPNNNPDNEDIAIRITANYDGKSIDKVFTATVYPIDPNKTDKNVISIISIEKEIKNFVKEKLFPELNFDKYFGDINASTSAKPFDFSDTKIWIGDNPELSRRVQEKAFESGWEWNDEGKQVLFTDAKLLYFWNNKTIGFIVDATKKDFDGLLFREITEQDIFGNQQTPTSTPVVPKTVETIVSDLDEAVQKLEKASSKVATEYNTEVYDKSLKFLYDTKATYELALKFTPESAFMYERLEIMKKLADLEKNIKRIEDMKKGGAFYILAKILEKLQRGENWRTSENAQDVITNQLPQSEIDVIIRSHKFKNWFGNWEKALVNDEYDNVSKALTNGIPSVYHHGARRIKYTYREVSNGVLYLAENISYALWFSQNSTAQSEEGNYLTDCFVNIKNPIDLTAFHVNQIDLADLVRYIDAIYPLAKIYDFIPAQVALLIKTNQPTNIIMWAWQLIRKYAKFVNHIKENTPYDGFLYYENNPSDQVINPVTGQSEENVTKAVAIFKSHQVKVVDAVLFDGGLDDWRFENGGKINN